MIRTVDDPVEEFADRRDVLARIDPLQDGTRSIRHPVIDYETVANDRSADHARRGVRLIDSTDLLPV